MTRREFEEAVTRLINQESFTSGDVWVARVYAASLIIIRQRRGIPDGEEFDVKGDEVAEFLAGLDAVSKRELKKIAELLISGGGAEPVL